MIVIPFVPCADCEKKDAEIRALRASVSGTSDLVPWYEADGSTVMLPAAEVEQRRRTAARVLNAARAAWIRRDDDSMIWLGRMLLAAAAVGAVEPQAGEDKWHTSPDSVCRKCGKAGGITYRTFGDHMDEQWKCALCGATGYCDGPDA